jgi:hypothetical protein
MEEKQKPYFGLFTKPLPKIHMLVRYQANQGVFVTPPKLGGGVYFCLFYKSFIYLMVSSAKSSAPFIGILGRL